jgi:hypothetical protein
MTAYTCSGSVRGECGKKHRSIGAAVACCKRDNNACSRHGGYSDRNVCRVDGKPLNDEELEAVADNEDAAAEF